MKAWEVVMTIDTARAQLLEEKHGSRDLTVLLEKQEKLTADEKKLITNRINGPLNERVREVMGPEFHFHTLRAIYGNLSHQLFGSNMSINAWLSRVLGHKPGSLSTAASYSTITISKQLPQEHTDIRNHITELNEQINALKAEIMKNKQELMQEAEQVIERKIEIQNHANVKLIDELGEEVIFQRQPRLHDGKQMERLLRAVAKLEAKKVRINWTNLRMLGYGDKVIAEYFRTAKDSPKKGLLDQRMKSKKRKVDEVVEEVQQ